jgi:hypothetical protein
MDKMAIHEQTTSVKRKCTMMKNWRKKGTLHFTLTGITDARYTFKFFVFFIFNKSPKSQKEKTTSVTWAK